MCIRDKYKLYRTRWWDYTDKPFNIGGYVCLEFSLMWGVGAMVMVKVIHPTIAALVNIIPPLVGFVLMCLLYAVYALSLIHIYTSCNKNDIIPL